MVQNTLTKIDQIKDELPRLYVSRADFEQRQELLEDTTRHISEKLDALAQGLPDRFLDRAQYLIAHAALEKRMETGEMRVEELRKEVSVEKQRVSELYANGMQWANDTFTGIRTLIAETRDLVVQRAESTERSISQMRTETLQREQKQLQREQNRQRQNRAQIGLILLSVGCGAALAFISTLILHALHVL